MGRRVQIGGLAYTVSHGNMFNELPVRKSFPLSNSNPSCRKASPPSSTYPVNKAHRSLCVPRNPDYSLIQCRRGVLSVSDQMSQPHPPVGASEGLQQACVCELRGPHQPSLQRLRNMSPHAQLPCLGPWGPPLPPRPHKENAGMPTCCIKPVRTDKRPRASNHASDPSSRACIPSSAFTGARLSMTAGVHGQLLTCVVMK